MCRLVVLAVLAASLMVGPAAAAELSEKAVEAIRAQHAAKRGELQAELQAAELALQKAKAMRIPTGTGKQKKQEQDAAKAEKQRQFEQATIAVATAKNKLTNFQANQIDSDQTLFTLMGPFDFIPLKVGQVGKFNKSLKARVMQIHSPQEMLVFVSGGPGALMVVLFRTSTAGLIDDTPFDFGDTVLLVSGTHKYEGRNKAACTVMVLEKVDMPAVRKALAARPNAAAPQDTNGVR